MQMALDLAQKAYRAKEVPVGAVLVKDKEVIATGYNQREGLQDPTAHAELLAIRTAAEVLGSWRLTDTTLYVTLEPCAMCAGAIIQARIGRLVFGTCDPKAGACGSICDLTAETRFNHRVTVHSGILAERLPPSATTIFSAASRGTTSSYLKPGQAERCESGRFGRSRKPLS